MTRTANWGVVAARWAKMGALSALLVGSLSSCLTVADDEGPILSMELFWDEETGSDYEGGTCDSADVFYMSWSLVDANGDEIASHRDEVDDDMQDCFNAIDIVDPGPGEYELRIDGYDSAKRKRWSGTCGGMSVLRFDVSYNCEIDRD